MRVSLVDLIHQRPTRPTLMSFCLFKGKWDLETWSLSVFFCLPLQSEVGGHHVLCIISGLGLASLSLCCCKVSHSSCCCTLFWSDLHSNLFCYLDFKFFFFFFPLSFPGCVSHFACFRFFFFDFLLFHVILTCKLSSFWIWWFWRCKDGEQQVGR